jgi:hypothetical protein
MPRFYFHLCDGDSYEDTSGVELTDIAAAKECARKFAREMQRGRPNEKRDIRVEDNHGKEIFRIPLSETS